MSKVAPKGPWAWRSLLLIASIGVAAVLFAANTPYTAEPQLDIEYDGFSSVEAEETVAAVRARIDGLTIEEALRLEPALTDEFPHLLHLQAPDVPRGPGLIAFALGLPMAVGLFGAFIVRRSGNAFGWWIVAGALIGALQGMGVAATEYLTRRDAAMALVFPFSVLAGTGWVIVAVVYFPNLLATFPNSRVLTPRWRWLWVLSGSAAVLLSAPVLFGPLLALETRVHPFPLLSAGAAKAIFGSGLLLWGITLLTAIVALVVRFIRAEGEERLQLKWVAVGAVFAGIALIVGNILQEGDIPDEVAGAISVVPLFVIVPIVLIITVFKHRLYDVDVVINKSVMGAILAAGITGIYAGIIYGVGALIGDDGISFELQVAAAVLVAMAFHPVRRRAQQFANRLVYGHRATPYEVLARFSHRAAEASDEGLLRRIPQLLADGTGAVEVALWVKGAEAYEAVATWPESTDRQSIPVVDGFADAAADASWPVRNAGEELGGISLVKARGESLSPAEEQLVSNLASGLGVVLRNNALTNRLWEQVEALAASRDRVLTAADEARRTLERDLDSGPQQRLVALKVMLGPIRKQAEQAGATKTAEILGQLETESGEAIQAVRDFAGGVYPPLLEAEGVAAAIAQQAQRAPFPIDLHVDEIGRYPREVEAAIYFTILEALQNAAKYASPSRVEVALAERAGELSFEVSDDGIGFDRSAVAGGTGLSNMADRIDSIGGTVVIESAPDRGTTVSGAVPIMVTAGV